MTPMLSGNSDLAAIWLLYAIVIPVVLLAGFLFGVIVGGCIGQSVVIVREDR